MLIVSIISRFPGWDVWDVGLCHLDVVYRVIESIDVWSFFFLRYEFKLILLIVSITRWATQDDMYMTLNTILRMLFTGNNINECMTFF
jgi:hypothetical protein